MESIVKGVKSTHGVAHQHKLAEAQMINQGLDILTVSLAAIVAILSPRAFAVSALVEGVAVILAAEHEAHHIPGMRIDSRAVEKDDKPAPAATPVQIVQAHLRRGNFAPFGQHNLCLDA